MGDLFSPGEQVDKQTIDPKLQELSNPLLDALMAFGSLGPMANMYQGPTVAAMNDAQKGVMDSTAQAGQAFGCIPGWRWPV